jgi:acyl-CoA synthetase (AMP-forming)/AMP-acid ligase II
LGSALRKAVIQHRDREAAWFEGRTQTFAELWQRSCRVANGLASLGLQPGDRVATLGDNAFESIETICGLALGGFVRCPMYVHNTGESHVFLMNLVGAKALVVQRTYLDDVLPHLDEIDSVEHVVVCDEAPPSLLAYDVLLANSATDDPQLPIRGSDPYIIRFSAGTTGRPKGILHTYDGWAAMGNEFALALPRVEADDSFLVAGPLSHAACLLFWPMLGAGVRHVVMPKFDAGRFLELVERERCTTSLLVPTMIQLVVSHPDAPMRDVTSLRAIYYGASPITESTLDEAHALWGPIMHQLYGQSESPAVTVLPARLHSSRHLLRAAGRPTPNVLLRILDDDGNVLPAGETGEVAVSSPGSMAGIWGDEAATRERVTDDGYLRTRDIGWIDDDGFLFLADRKEDIIISGGFNVWPAEVENALCAHPAVLEAAVVGVPDEKWGETVLAVVVLRPGGDATSDELIAWCRTKVGPVKKPTRVEFSDEPLPKNGVGKLLRRAVRAQCWQGADRQVSGA